jgi:alanine racemase
MRAAILPVGYGHGYRHALANKAHVLIRGQRCPVRGSVCMDQIVVDITEVPEVAPGDVVTLIGVDGDEAINAAELAGHAQTISYDILAGIAPRVPREYVE